MTLRKRRITLVSGPEIVAELGGQKEPLVERYGELSSDNAADRKALDEIRKDPYADPRPRSYTPLSEIQAWVRWRDEQSKPLMERLGVRDGEMLALSKRMSSLTQEQEEVQRAVSEREKRLKKLKAERALQSRFRDGISDARVFREYVGYTSERLLGFLDSSGIELCGWDKFDRELHGMDSARDSGYRPHRRIEPLHAWRLASIKTLAAVSGQLRREVGAPNRRSVAEGLLQSLMKADIRTVLEVGPGRRGIVDVLAESGIAEKADLKLYAVDMRPREERKAAFAAAGILFVEGNAVEAGRIFKDKTFDMILAVGVMSAGGIQDGEGAEDYAGFVEKSHQIADGLAQVLSDNPHAMLACSGIHGTMTLLKDRLRDSYSIAYWQTPPEDARKNDREKAFPDCPIRPGEIHHTREQGIRFREWVTENAARLEFADRLFEQSTDLAVLKKK